MKCENLLCVYESNGECRLEQINVDRLGMCAECIYVSIDEALLEKEKSKLLKRYVESD